VASIWKHQESQYWTACFREQNSRQRRIMTKERDYKKALKIAEELVGRQRKPGTSAISFADKSAMADSRTPLIRSSAAQINASAHRGST
jgi:hypothetical protein